MIKHRRDKQKLFITPVFNGLSRRFIAKFAYMKIYKLQYCGLHVYPNDKGL